MKTLTASRLVASCLLTTLLISGLSGCAHRQAASSPVAASPIASDTFIPIVIDGDIGEWPAANAAYADEHYLYTRFTVADDQFTLQTATKSVALIIDCDGDAATGQPMKSGSDTVGADLLAVFSPKGQNGVSLFAVGNDGTRTRLDTADFDFVFAPTYASGWYEARICRTPDRKDALPQTGLLGPGTIRGFAAVLGPDDTIAASSEVFQVTTDMVCLGGRRLASEDPPAPSANSVRLMSWNIELSKPMDNPAPFARVIRALQPDVLLLQEWEKGDASSVETWFTTNVGGIWRVVKAPGNLATGGGVLIATRYELNPAIVQPITCTVTNDKGQEENRPVRFVSGSVSTPLGTMLVGSMHLKARGGLNSSEDRRRAAESAAINTAIAEFVKTSRPTICVLSGDMNLVGGRAPIDILRASIDNDGSDLTTATPMVLGDQALYTWKNGSSPFTPGRLDWMLYSDSTATVRHAFVLDSARLSDEALARLTLERGDTSASDHLPVVVDLSGR